MSKQIKEAVQCPGCASSETRKHGKHLGKQRYYCKKCGLAFTGEAYHYRPAQEVSALKEEIHRLLKIAEAAGRLNAALVAYLEKNSGKALSNLKAKRERLERLLAEGNYLKSPDNEDELEGETEITGGLF